MFRVIQIPVGGLDHNWSYLVISSDGYAAIIDPCGDSGKIRDALMNTGNITPAAILLTHAHRDHMDALNDVLEFLHAPVMGYRNLNNHQHIDIGKDDYLEVIYAPGHSYDSVLYRAGDDSALFTGDTLFVDCVGFGDSDTLFHTLRYIADNFPDHITVYPGHDHGDVPAATLGELKKSNLFLRCTTIERFRRAHRMMN